MAFDIERSCFRRHQQLEGIYVAASLGGMLTPFSPLKRASLLFSPKL